MILGSNGLHTLVHGLVRCVFHLQYKICILHATNTVEAWLLGYWSLCFLAHYSFLHHWASLVWLKMRPR